jgi:hypothetical protein
MLKLPRRQFLHLAAGSAALAALTAPATAQAPSLAGKNVQMIIGSGTGGGFDFGTDRERGQRRVPARPDVLPDPPSLTKGLNLVPARPEGMIENYNDTVARFDEIFNKAN